MSMRLPGASALVACLALASAAAAQPSSPLNDVPGDAVIAVQLHGLDRTRERIATTLKNAFPKEGEQLAAQADEALKRITQGRDLKGAAKDGPVFLVFTKLPGAEMEEFQKSALLMVATSDYQALRDGLLTEEERKSLKKDPAGFETATVKDEAVCLFQRGNFACVTPSPAIAGRLAKKTEGPGLAKKLGAAAASFLGPDLALFVDMSAVNEQYGNEIKSGQQIVEFGLQQAEGGGVPGLDKSQVEAARMMFNGIFQALEDCKVILVSADFRPEGVALRLQTRFGPDSRSNELLKTFRPANLGDLGTLPTGQTTYSAVQVSEVLQKMLGSMMGAGGIGGANAEEAKKAATALADLANGPILSASSFPPAGLTVSRYKNPARAVELTTQLFKGLPEGGAYQNAYLKGKPELKADAEKHRGFTFHFAHLRYDLDKMTASMPDEATRDASKEAMKRLLGTESRVWYGTDGKQFLTLVAKDWPAARAILDAYLDGKSLSKDPGYAALVKELPAESSMLFVADAPKLAAAMGDYVGSMVKAMPGFPGQVPAIKPAAGPATYAGVALTLHAEEGRLDIFVTGAAVRAVRKAIEAGAAGEN